jgi:hypothetical protein
MGSKYQRGDDIMLNDSIYVKNGYRDREDYLQSLAEDYDVNYTTVLILSDMLGESEDFDGLVTSLEDYEDLHGN